MFLFPWFAVWSCLISGDWAAALFPLFSHPAQCELLFSSCYYSRLAIQVLLWLLSPPPYCFFVLFYPARCALPMHNVLVIPSLDVRVRFLSPFLLVRFRVNLYSGDKSLHCAYPTIPFFSLFRLRNSFHVSRLCTPASSLFLLPVSFSWFFFFLLRFFPSAQSFNKRKVVPFAVLHYFCIHLTFF